MGRTDISLISNMHPSSGRSVMSRNICLQKLKSFCLIGTLLLVALLPAVRAAIRVDLNEVNDRKDMWSRNAENWSVPDGTAASQTFGQIKLTLRSTKGNIAAHMWKGGIDSGAVLAND